jgi:hypothetical protein
MDGLHFSDRGMILSLFKLCLAGLSHDDPVPAETLSAMQSNNTFCDKNLTVDSLLLEHLDMDIQLPMLVNSKGSQ